MIFLIVRKKSEAEYFAAIMEDRLWQLPAVNVFPCRNKSNIQDKYNLIIRIGDKQPILVNFARC